MALFDVPGAGDSQELADAIGKVGDTLGGHPATITGRLLLFARNLLYHALSLLPDLNSGLPNPSSERPTHEGENLRSVEHGKTWETEGLFIFSELTDKGYEMAYENAIGGTVENYNARVDLGGVQDIDIRDATDGTLIDSDDTIYFTDPYRVAGALSLLFAAAGLDIAVAYSGWRVSADSPGPNGETTPEYKFTAYSPGNTTFDLIVGADTSSLWPSLGFTLGGTGADRYQAQNVAIHTEEYATIRLANPRLGFDRDLAYINSWRHLVLDTNFVPSNQVTPFQRVRMNLHFIDDLAAEFDIDFTGQQFATKEALAEFIQDELNDQTPQGYPYGVLIDLDGAITIQAVDPVGIDLIVSSDPFSVGPLIGFAGDTFDTFGFTQGAPFNLAAFNSALNQLRPGSDKIVVYLASNLSSLDQAPDSNFTETVDMFPLRDDTYMGTAWGTDAAGWPRIGQPSPSGHDLFPARYLWIDLYSWKGSAPTAPWIRVKIVNRQNPAGRLVLGQAFAGPALVNVWNVGADADDTILDRCGLERSPAGALSSTYRRSGAMYDIATEVLTKDEALVLRTALLDARCIDLSQPHALAPDRNLIGLKVRPVWAIDPSNRSDLLSDVAKAYGMIQGRIVSFSMKPSGRLAQGYFTCVLTVEGER